VGDEVGESVDRRTRLDESLLPAIGDADPVENRLAADDEDLGRGRDGEPVACAAPEDVQTFVWTVVGPTLGGDAEDRARSRSFSALRRTRAIRPLIAQLRL